MKLRFIILLLLASFLAPAIATYIGLSHQKHVIRKEVRHHLVKGVDKEELVKLVFPINEVKKPSLRWKHDKEFEYDGEMYDVVESGTTLDSVYYWCWWDHGETRLNHKLNHIVFDILGQNSDREENKNKLKRFYKTLFFEDLRDLYSPQTECSMVWRYDRELIGWNPPPTCPPPEVKA